MNDAEKAMMEAEKRMNQMYGVPQQVYKPTPYPTPVSSSQLKPKHDSFAELERRAAEIEAKEKQQQRPQAISNGNYHPQAGEYWKHQLGHVNQTVAPVPSKRPVITYVEAGDFPGANPKSEEPAYKAYQEDLKPTYKPRRARGLRFRPSKIVTKF